jgi:hypothetical protein
MQATAWLNGRAVLFSLGGALVVEVVLVLLTNFITGPGGAMGTPLPISFIRRGPISSILEGSPAPGAGQVAVAWAVFVLDVGITAVPIYLLSLWVGGSGALLAAVGGLILALALAWAMYALKLPVVGAPIPIAYLPAEEIISLALWADCLILAGVLAFVMARLRA